MRRGNRFLIIDPWDNESVFTYYSEFEEHWAGKYFLVNVKLLGKLFMKTAKPNLV